MLTGKELGAAIASAIRMKGVKKAHVAKHFGIKPPSISDWINRGTIDKAKLEKLFAYFSDVVGPAHWGLSGDSISMLREPSETYPINVTPFPVENPLRRELMVIADRMSDRALQVLIYEAEKIDKAYPRALPNAAN